MLSQRIQLSTYPAPEAWQLRSPMNQKLALVTPLTRIIANDRYPSSPYVRTLRDILSKLDPKPAAQPSLAPKAHALPEEMRTRSLHQG